MTGWTVMSLRIFSRVTRMGSHIFGFLGVVIQKMCQFILG